jgi:hypothetical protein
MRPSGSRTEAPESTHRPCTDLSLVPANAVGYTEPWMYYTFAAAKALVRNEGGRLEALVDTVLVPRQADSDPLCLIPTPLASLLVGRVRSVCSAPRASPATPNIGAQAAQNQPAGELEPEKLANEAFSGHVLPFDPALLVY